MNSSGIPLLALPVILFAATGCGSSNNAASPAPSATPTVARQVVVQSTLPTGPTNKKLHVPTPDPRVTPGRLPTVPPVPTMTSIPASAYTAVVFGSVLDGKTNSPVAGALVTVGTGQRSGRTSAYGAYRFTFPAGIAVPVTVSAPGFAGALAMGILKPHQKLKLDFKLARIVPGKPPVPPPPTTFGHP